MEDKGLAAQWFEEHQIPAPRGQGFPRIAKARLGFGSRDQIIAESAIDLEWFFSKHQQGDYLVQEFVRGQEYTVDAYVDRDGRLIGALSRKRLAVSAGEVDHSETHRHEPILQLTTRILAVPGWEGPITLQFIEGPDGPVVIEVNPRFGGGVTHSIHCGLDMPRWAIRELLGRSVDPFDKWENGSIMTRCRRDVFLRS